MYADFLFEMRKSAVNGIRRVRDIEIGVTFVSEEIGQGALDSEEGCSRPSVRVVPLDGQSVNGFLAQERILAFVPGKEPGSELLLGRSRQGQG